MEVSVAHQLFGYPYSFVISRKKKKSYTFEQLKYIVYDDRILSTITLRNKHQQQ